MKDYLLEPIPRIHGIAGVGLCLVGAGIMYVEAKKLLKQADEIIADQDQRLKIFKESVDFLLENANDRTIVELNSNLDYWRVIRGIDPPCDCPAHEYKDRECSCYCDHSKEES